MGKFLTGLKVGGWVVFALLGVLVVGFGRPGSGWRALSVQTGSMRPAVRPGDLVFVKHVPASDLRVGDVITYASKSNARQTITHRIVDIQGESKALKQITTKGDANELPDAPISEQQIVGKVARTAPLLGRLLDTLRTPLGLLILVYVPALGVVWGELKRLSLYYKTRESELAPKILAGRKILIIRPNMLLALVVALSLLQTLPALAALRTTATLTGTTISSAPIISPPEQCGGSGNTNTNINITNNSTQTSTTGNASNSNNTTGGSATTGNATNSNTTSTTIIVC